MKGRSYPCMTTSNLPNFKVSNGKHVSSLYQNSEGMKTHPCSCLGYCKNCKSHFNTYYFTLYPVALNYTFPQFQYWTKCSVEWFHFSLLFRTKFLVIFILKNNKNPCFFDIIIANLAQITLGAIPPSCIKSRCTEWVWTQLYLDIKPIDEIRASEILVVSWSKECTSVARHSSQHDITQHGMLPQHPTGTAKLMLTFYSVTLASVIRLRDDGPRTETCRSVFNVLMCKILYMCQWLV